MGNYYQDEFNYEIHHVDEKNDFYKAGRCGCYTVIFIIGLAVGVYFGCKKVIKNNKQKTEQVQKVMKNSANIKKTAVYNNFVKGL